MPTAKTAKSTTPDPYVGNLLGEIQEGKRILSSRKGETLFSQGEPADAVFFIQSGKVKVTVVSRSGKEAVIAMFGSHDLLGEGALGGEVARVSTATVMEASVIYRVEKLAMKHALLAQPDLSARFIAVLLARNTDLEEDLCDQLFNHSEKRLARVLLKLVWLHEHRIAPDATIPIVNHEILAEMVGTTRSRITYFMNKFRKMGLIDYSDELTVKTEMLTNIVLRD